MKKLFVLGDSISIQYGPYLKKFLEGRFLYDRKRGEAEALADLDHPVGANGGDSRMVLEYLEQEKHNDVRYHILLFNCGLHDIKTNPRNGEKQVTPQQYRANLERIVMLAKDMADKLIWITTTDAVEQVHNRSDSSFLRFHHDVVAYNAISDEVMSNHNVPIIDLYTFTRRFGTVVFCDHVHYSQEIRQLQAAYIAGYMDSLFDRED